MVCAACDTVKPCVTDVAALKFALPFWFAVMLQVPTVSSVTDAPEIVHTDVVLETKATVSPDVAVAMRLIGVVVNGCDAGPVKAML